MKNVVVDTSIWSSILEASILVQLTLLFLVLLSIASWAVILSKYYQFKVLAEANSRFLSRYQKAKSIKQIEEDAEDLSDRSSLARLFLTSLNALDNLRTLNSEAQTKLDKQEAKEILERELGAGLQKEIMALESRLTLLATAGSTGPFIGLFGTVWGIMNSFQKIGAMGSASLAVVAPGISEALVATAVGLFAAIPASMFYNQFISKIRKEEIELNAFAGELITVMPRSLGE